MLDLRAMLNDRTYLTTFIVGNRYVTVVHQNKVLEEILQEVESYLGSELAKPFVIVQSAFIYREDGAMMNDRGLIDVYLGD